MPPTASWTRGCATDDADDRSFHDDDQGALSMTTLTDAAVVPEPLIVTRPANAQLTKRRRRRIPLTVIIPGAVIAVLAVIAVFAPVLAPHGPTSGALKDRLQGIGTPGHLLGTDGRGQDILSRLIWGARPSLLAGLIPVVVAGTVGTLL